MPLLGRLLGTFQLYRISFDRARRAWCVSPCWPPDSDSTSRHPSIRLSNHYRNIWRYRLLTFRHGRIISGSASPPCFVLRVGQGEFSDKATQSELQELQGTIESSQSGGQGNISILQNLLSSIPSGIFGGKDEAGKAEELQMNAQAAQMQNMNISPRQPEAWTRQLQEIAKQIGPIIEWHDEIMQSITETIEKIPILPDLIEQVTGTLHTVSSARH